MALHAEVRPPRAARPGHLAKRDNEYRRCSIANIFGIVEPKAGRHFTRATPNRSAAQFARQIRSVVVAYPRTHTIHLVLHNFNIHCEQSRIDCYGTSTGRRLWRRLTVHHTSKHGSWLNQAEIELSLIARQCLGTDRIPELRHLQARTRAWDRRTNR